MAAKRMQTRKVIIDGIEFTIFPFGAWYSASLSGELAKVLGPIVAGLAPLFLNGDVGSLLSRDLSEIMPGIMEALKSLDGDVIEKLLGDLLIKRDNVSCVYKDEDGRRVTEVLTMDLADELFCQNIDGMLELAIEVVKFNFSGFFKRTFTRLGAQSQSEEGQTQSNTDILPLNASTKQK